jgi:hypothetical protein
MHVTAKDIERHGKYFFEETLSKDHSKRRLWWHYLVAPTMIQEEGLWARNANANRMKMPLNDKSLSQTVL